MNEASALFENLVQDFGKPAHAAKVALIAGADEDITRLNQDNEEFMALYSGRALAEEEEKVEGSMSEARKVVEEKFDVLAEAINTFYRINEMQSPKDPEVSDSLTQIILFINAYLHQHEATFARRSANYHSGGSDQPSSPDEEPQKPDATVPHILISAQETLGDSVALPGFGNQMSLLAADAAAFAAALYPSAKNGLLQLTWPDTDNTESLPIADFVMDTDTTTPLGLLVDSPNLNTAFIKPFTGTGDAEAEVWKDNQLLATLQGVQFPATMSEG
ncbi:MAG: DUF6261 family protein [Tannerellaceae bacterium]|jgi:hypothetical protein|nr:DUF6261 family protein [Tannerellaceae bacterium]